MAEHHTCTTIVYVRLIPIPRKKIESRNCWVRVVDKILSLSQGCWIFTHPVATATNRQAKLGGSRKHHYGCGSEIQNQISWCIRWPIKSDSQFFSRRTLCGLGEESISEYWPLGYRWGRQDHVLWLWMQEGWVGTCQEHWREIWLFYNTAKSRLVGRNTRVKEQGQLSTRSLARKITDP